MKKQFIFTDYSFDATSKTLELEYGFDDGQRFTEKYIFDFEFTTDLDHIALDKAIQGLWLMAGVSYYKAFLAEEIVVQKPILDTSSAAYFAKTYQKGLGEFFYINNLNPSQTVPFAANTDPTSPAKSNSAGLLIAIGGGKDSLVSAELLRQQPKVATWCVGHRQQLEPLIKTIGLPHFWVERTIDPQLYELNAQGALNGHIPISAIIAHTGAVLAVLTGYKDVVVSNENSTNEPTLEYQGVAINHQYSKSLEYEQDFQEYLKEHFNESIHYYSFLRPLSELKIAELFARVGFDKYKSVFSSCNRAFRHESNHIFWCGECPKCAFVFLAFTPFIDRTKLEALFSGKNLLLAPDLEETYKNLLGISGEKPLECVGEIKENRSAMREAFKTYPELENKYTFDIPDAYDYRALAPHSMPEDLYQILIRWLERLQ